MPLPVISVEQMRQWEKAAWAAGNTAAAVIKRIGRLIAARVLLLTRPGDTILILAGRGHNGDDARAALPHLPGRKPALVQALDPRAAAKEFLQKTKSASIHHRPPWIIDALFGIGLNRPLDEPWRTLIDAVNQSGLPVLSVDVPSGLNADSGQVEGAAIRADITLTIGAPKRGLLQAPEWVGRLEVAHDIGWIPCPHSTELNWTLPEDFAAWPLRRPVQSNKGTFGHLAIIAGSRGYHGAAVLAARGALRAQPGLVTVEPQPSVYFPVAAQVQAAMARPWQAGRPLPANCTALLFGPGLAQPNLPAALAKKLRSWWKTFPGPMLVDASALDWLQPGAIAAGAVRVITPHPGEAGRLLRVSAEAIQADRLGSLRQLSRRLGNCHVVLKGHHTLVGRATGAVYINSSGNPLLAQGGSGDLLSGYLAGLLAQPACRRDPLTAIRFAVWQHGASADTLSQSRPNWTVEDLANALGSARPGD
ncbi:MAG: NAD(P)H-hydrate dehydratase [Verrucomicrobiota bacterium]|jgi:NAD(P)H-hydrate epimerase